MVADKRKGDAIRDRRVPHAASSRWFYKSIEDLLLESVGETPLYKRYSLAPILHWDHKSTRSQMEEDDQLGAYT